MSISELENVINNVDVRNNLIQIKKQLANNEYCRKFKSDSNYSVELFAGFLEHEDPKVRKNAVLIMGLLDDVKYKQIIFEGYKKENTLFVKSSYVAALAKYNCPEYKDYFQNRKEELLKDEKTDGEIKHIADELREIKKMLDEPETKQLHTYRRPQKSIPVFLTCRKELTQTLLEDISKEMPKAVADRVFCGVSVKNADFSKLYSVRYFKEILIPLNGLKTYDAGSLAKFIIDGNLFEILDAFHVEKELPYRFRLSGKDVDSVKIAGELELLSSGRLINSVSDYEVEIRLIADKNNKYGGLIKLYTNKDRRFFYRNQTVATSLHPVNAAGMIRLVKDYLAHNAQIIDPFAGIGTLLIERNKSVRAKYMYALDIFGEAVAYGRSNSQSAGADINYIQRDFFDFRHEYLFDEIITEFPKFEKGRADDFYRRFFDKSNEILRDNGLMILASGEKGIIKKYLRLHSEYELIDEKVFSTKEEINLYIIRKIKKVG